MGVSGRYVSTFAEGNIAYASPMHMDSDYPHKFFDVLEQNYKFVRLKSHWDSTEFTFPIKRETSGQEFAAIEQSSSFERIFNRKPAKHRVYPMNGKRI